MPLQGCDPGLAKGNAACRSWAFVAVALLAFSHISCKRSNTNASSPGNLAESVPEKTAEAPAPVVKVPETPPLPPSALAGVVNMAALVQIPEQAERVGILLEGASASSSNRNHLVICEVPAELESVRVAFHSSGKIGKALAKRISILPSGLSLYGFTTKSSLSSWRPAAPTSGETYHAIRLKGEGSITPEHEAAMTAELETIRSRMSELRDEERQTMRSRGMNTPEYEDPRQMRPDSRQAMAAQRERERELQQARETIRREMNELTTRQSELGSLLAFSVASIAAEEVAAALTRDSITVMAGPPVLPKKAGVFGAALAPDRGCYFDSSLGVLLLPDGGEMHVLRIRLPEQEKRSPDFILAGEAFEIPLPAGTAHKLTSVDGGTSEIGPTSIRWVAPVVNDYDRRFILQLDWTGELGSQIHKDYQIRVIQPAGNPEVLSADGRSNIPLHRRAIFSEVDSDIVGCAGSGSVVLVNESGAFSAWNLFSGEMILRKKVDFQRILGDADRIYVLDRNGRLTSYDILTGEEAGTADLGGKIHSIADMEAFVGRAPDLPMPVVEEAVPVTPADPGNFKAQVATSRTVTSEVRFKTGVTAQLVDAPPGVVYHQDRGMLEWTPAPFSKTLCGEDPHIHVISRN
jgi:hypothetical protein